MYNASLPLDNTESSPPSAATPPPPPSSSDDTIIPEAAAIGSGARYSIFGVYYLPFCPDLDDYDTFVALETVIIDTLGFDTLKLKIELDPESLDCGDLNVYTPGKQSKATDKDNRVSESMLVLRTDSHLVLLFLAPPRQASVISTRLSTMSNKA